MEEGSFEGGAGEEKICEIEGGWKKLVHRSHDLRDDTGTGFQKIDKNEYFIPYFEFIRDGWTLPRQSRT